MAQETVILGNGTLPFSDVARVARAGARVTLGEDAHARVERSWRRVQELSESGDAVYGVSTGFGALSTTQATTLTVRVWHASFDDWWQPFTLGVGPAGAYAAALAPGRRAALREQCRRLLPTGAIAITAVAWAASGRA